MQLERTHTNAPFGAPVPAFNFLFAGSETPKPPRKLSWLTRRRALRSRRV